MKKFFALLLALCLVFSLAACAGDSEEGQNNEQQEEQNNEEQNNEQQNDNEQKVVLTHDEYMAAEIDSEVTVEAYVQAKQSWWEDKATVYAQDEDGAYFFYDMACSEEDYELLVPGTCIRVTGYKSEWSGEVEIIDGTFEIVEGDEFIATPLDVTEMLAGNDVAFLYNWDGSGAEGDDLYFNVSYNDQVYTFTVESYLCDSTTEVYSAVKNLQIGQVIDAEGFLYWYEGVNPHITSVTVVG